MYKVLIVDDEEWVLKSLQDSVEWNANGFTVAGTATDGAEAIQMADILHPDLIVTDIRMPIMDGMELIRQARANWPGMQFVIVSGYAEFEYAKKAIAFGAAGYCLKPVEEKEMAEVLNAVRTRLSQQSLKIVELQQSVEEIGSEAASINAYREAGLLWDDIKNMRVLSGPLRLPSSGYQALSTRNRLYLVPEGDIGWFMSHQDDESSIGLSQCIKSPLRLNEAVSEAKIAEYHWFMTSTHGVYEYMHTSRNALGWMAGQLAEAVFARNRKKTEDMLTSIEKELLGGLYNIRHAYYCYMRLSDILDQQNGEPEDGEIDSYSMLPDLFLDARAMMAWFHEQFGKIFGNAQQETGEVSMSVVSEILRYMEENAERDISLSAIADRFHLNPSYLCRIFKRQTGKPLMEHLMGIRLGKACNLLKSTRLSINSIAEKCGYGDYFYFARLFKRSTGLTPSQYRSGINPPKKSI